MKTIVVLTTENPYGLENIEIPASYNMTKSALFDRNPDIELKLVNKTRMIVMKEYIAGIKEVESIIEEKNAAESEVATA